MKANLLLIDDDNDFLTDLEFLLKNDFNILKANNGASATELLNAKSVDLILLDLVLEEENGLDLLKELKRREPYIPVIMITEHSSIDTAIEAVKIGAENYVSKDLNVKELKALIQKELHRKLNVEKSKLLMEEANKPYQKIIGKSEAINQIREKITLAAEGDFTVIVTGESGTGKELVARQIHNLSKRKNEIFVAINCGALPDQLIESELFGYEAGAFTGANKRKLGKFEIAGNGTIFLDEIAELKLESQVKLMRVLQNREFERIGGSSVLRTNARVIAATNKNLDSLMRQGKFREDLYYRLEVFPIYLPPLRERKEDIPLLINYFLKMRAKEMNLPLPILNENLIKLFLSYDWPGNIRELDNVVTRLLILSKGKDFNENLIKSNLGARKKIHLPEIEKLSLDWNEFNRIKKLVSQKAANQVESLFVEKLLKEFNGNITKAAKQLGIDRTTLHRLIAKVRKG